MQFVRESIFVSAIRAFFNALLAMIGVLVGLIILCGVLISFSSASTAGVADLGLQMEILPDAKGEKKLLPETAPVLLQINIEGTIGGELLQGEQITKMLNTSQGGMIKKDRVKGILLNINSPGGTVLDSDMIYREVLRYKQEHNIPVYVYTSGMCASGGYYIACSGDKIFASPVAIVGSVGVLFGPQFNFWQLMQKHGINSVTLTKGVDKVKFPMFEKMPDKEKPYEDLVAIIDDLYDQFVSLVVAARETAGLTKEKLVNQFGARLYVSNSAKANGYVDEVGVTYETALNALAEKAGVKENYQVITFEVRRSVVRDLLTNKSPFSLKKIRQALLGEPAVENWETQPLYYYNMFDR